jgi:hypothetical protein
MTGGEVDQVDRQRQVPVVRRKSIWVRMEGVTERSVGLDHGGSQVQSEGMERETIVRRDYRPEPGRAVRI